MAETITRRQAMTCDRCGEVHTNDALNLTKDPAQDFKTVARTCAFCEYGVEEWAANGNPTRLDRKTRVTREEDRLEAEEELV